MRPYVFDSLTALLLYHFSYSLTSNFMRPTCPAKLQVRVAISPTLQNLDPTGYRNVDNCATLKKSNTLVVKPPLLSFSFPLPPPPPRPPPNPLVRLVVQLSFEDNRSSPPSSRFLPRTFRPHLTQAERRRRRRVMQSGGGAVITASPQVSGTPANLPKIPHCNAGHFLPTAKHGIQTVL